MAAVGTAARHQLDAHRSALGEMACLGALWAGDAHGYVIAAELSPAGRIGSAAPAPKSLTYRRLHQLTSCGCIEETGRQPGTYGGPRTMLRLTEVGRTNLEAWMRTPIDDPKDVPGGLQLKAVLAGLLGVSVDSVLDGQRQHLLASLGDSSDANESFDSHRVWREELCRASLRFIDRFSSRCA